MRCDARNSQLTGFTMPDAIRDVSLAENYAEQIPLELQNPRAVNQFEIAESGVFSHFEQAASGSCSFIYVVKGCKTFYVIAPTELNQDLFDRFMYHARADMFFGAHEQLNFDGCRKIVVKERQAIILPGRMIFMTETTGLTVTVGEFPRKIRFYIRF